MLKARRPGNRLVGFVEESLVRLIVWLATGKHPCCLLRQEVMKSIASCLLPKTKPLPDYPYEEISLSPDIS